jgi:hypothetical protein
MSNAKNLIIELFDDLDSDKEIPTVDLLEMYEDAIQDMQKRIDCLRNDIKMGFCK